MENVDLAAQKGVMLIPTALTSSETNPLYADFKLDEDGRSLLTCPRGCSPDRQKFNGKTGKVTAWFARPTCEGCPYFDSCPHKKQKKECKVEVTKEQVARADFQGAISEKDYSQHGRERNAVEAIPSIFRRKYGIDHMRTRRPGIRQAKFFCILMAYNGQKHQKFLNRHRVDYAFA